MIAGNTVKKKKKFFTVQWGMFVSSEEQAYTWER
jgi:hypothetical protein